MRCVVKAAGLIAVTDADYSVMTSHPANAEIENWLATYHAVADALGAQPDAGRPLLASANPAGPPDVGSSAGAWCFDTPEKRAWWGGLSAERIAQSDVATHAFRNGLASREQLEQMAAAC